MGRTTITGKTIRGETIRGETIRGETIRGEMIRSENVERSLHQGNLILLLHDLQYRLLMSNVLSIVNLSSGTML